MPFVNEWKDKVEGFVVNCGAGRSRSAGVAAAISESLGLDPAIYYEAPFNPNPLIRRLVEESMKSNQCIPVDHWNQRVKVDGLFPDAVEEFDRNWIGPEALRPTVYRSQSEKDCWHACVIENEYNAPGFNESDIVVDIGANIGAFCKRAHLNGSREIYGFEPSKFYMEAAKANVGDLEGVSLHQLAVVRSDDKRKPQYFHDNGMSTMVDEGNPVENVSLDEILGDLGPVRFLKIDCEGAEWTILRTSTKLDRVQEIAGEYHLAGHYDDNVSVGALMGFLYDQGFTQAGFHKQADATGGFWAKR